MTEAHPQNGRKRDLADHFVSCNKLGRHLTLMDESRFVISDDFIRPKSLIPTAAAIASICSEDPLVAQAALVPLGMLANRKSHKDRERFEELFSMIEERSLNSTVRNTAHDLLTRGFQKSLIRSLEADLGGKITPARKRYGKFLERVRQLIEGKISASAFRDEFLAFTYDVAGRLDFGIYSYCMDRIYANPRIPIDAKRFMVGEIIKYPKLIRRELISNILTGQVPDPEFKNFVRDAISIKLEQDTVAEIYLLEQFKLHRISMSSIEDMLKTQTLVRSPKQSALV